MRILNLGCGTKTSEKPEVINIDWSIFLRLKRVKLLALFMPVIFRGERLERFKALPDNIMVHDLTKGIPFPSNDVDAVYHSHMLEHFDKDVAEKLMIEAKRVLKDRGVHRIVVPDLEKICRSYVAHISSCEAHPDESGKHDMYIASLLEQSVRKESHGTSRQKALRRFIENRVLGDARQRGETHQWMYDRINLKAKLLNMGYREVHIQTYNTSLIPRWIEYGLDADGAGCEYKPGSLYVEALA